MLQLLDMSAQFCQPRLHLPHRPLRSHLYISVTHPLRMPFRQPALRSHISYTSVHKHTHTLSLSFYLRILLLHTHEFVAQMRHLMLRLSCLELQPDGFKV